MAALATFRTATADLWLLDIARNIVSRFTYDDATEVNPVWSPDGARLVFSTNRAGVHNMFVKAMSGSSEEKADQPVRHTPQYVTDWTPDGNTLLFAGLDPKMQWDILSVPVSGDNPPTTILSTGFNEYAARVSPDGRWMALHVGRIGTARGLRATIPNRWRANADFRSRRLRAAVATRRA